ncbi:aminoglycoside phosphotransferase family protein [Dactylosporangium sp. CA-139066]|uniref:aminoglycoside phosphotransferase family protein n=1 Tax=Dactylosporangium sp. CA-139066 TaxID=3239930 RepID=UPI003D8B31AB
MITAALRQNVTATWGEEGARWLERLPETLSEISALWDLVPGEPFDLSYHYVAPATLADGTPAVLKLGVPSAGSLAEEAPALTAFAGRGAVRLLRADLPRGALLLERALPGRRARDVPEPAATSAAVAVMRVLHVPSPPVLPDVLVQARAFDAYLARFPDADGPLPHAHVTTAAGLMRELCASSPSRVLLHGDLHHDNILEASRSPWLAIDPHGLTGDPAYEIGSWLFNPTPANRDPSLTALVPSRLEQFAAELGYPLERLVAWGFVKSVLSDVWTAESWVRGATWSPVSRAHDVASLLLAQLP